MMKRTFGVLAMVCAMAGALCSQNTTTFGNIVAMGVPCGAVNCVYYQLPASTPSVAIAVTGTWSGTIEIATTSDPTANYGNLSTLAWTVLATETANGSWSASTSGVIYLRARATSWTSGSARVAMTSSQNWTIPLPNPLFSGTVTANGLQAPDGGSGSNCWYTNGSSGACGSGGMTYPGAGIPLSTGSAWGTSLTAPTGALVGAGQANTYTSGLQDLSAVTVKLGGISGPISGPSASFGTINNTCMADQQAGADMGAKIAACNAALVALPIPSGGIIDATGFQGVQTASSGFTVGQRSSLNSAPYASVTLKLGTVQLTTGDTIHMGPGSYIQGTGFIISPSNPESYSSQIIGNTSGKPVIDMIGTQASSIRGVSIVGSCVTSPTTGITVARLNLTNGYHEGNEIKNTSVTGCFSGAAVYVVATEVFTVDRLFVDVQGGGAKYGLDISQIDNLGLGMFQAVGATMIAGSVTNTWVQYTASGVAGSAGIYFGGGGATREWNFENDYVDKSDTGAFVEIETNQILNGVTSLGSMGGPNYFTNVDGEREGGTPNTGFWIHGTQIGGQPASILQLRIDGISIMPATNNYIDASTVTLEDAHIYAAGFASGTGPAIFGTVSNSELYLPFVISTIGNAYNSDLTGGETQFCGTCSLTVTGYNTSRIHAAQQLPSYPITYNYPQLHNASVDYINGISYDASNLTNPSSAPSGVPLTTGGTIPISNFNYAQIVAFTDNLCTVGHTLPTAISSAVITTTAVSSIYWSWPPTPKAQCYQVWSCQGSGCTPIYYFTSTQNTYNQTAPASSGTSGTLPVANTSSGSYQINGVPVLQSDGSTTYINPVNKTTGEVEFNLGSPCYGYVPASANTPAGFTCGVANLNGTLLDYRLLGAYGTPTIDKYVQLSDGTGVTNHMAVYDANHGLTDGGSAPSGQVAANLASSGATGVTGILPGANGGTGVANTGITETFAANFNTTGTGAPTLAFPATTSYTYTHPAYTGTILEETASDTTTTHVCHATATTGVCTFSAVVSADLPSQYKIWTCETGLGDGLNAFTSGTYHQHFCVNKTGGTVTITGVSCYADGGTPTLNASGTTLGALLTGAVTCTTATAGAAGTQSANVALTNGDAIDFTFVSGSTATQTNWVVTGTY